MYQQDIFPPPSFDPPARVSSLAAYRFIYRDSIENPYPFWRAIAHDRLAWTKKPTAVLEADLPQGRIRWFEDGVLNASFNCLDRHVLGGRGDQIALIWEPNDPRDEPMKFTYRALLRDVQMAANALKRLGVQRGDRVCIYLQMIPELAIAMLACARIGAIHSVVFGAFSAEALRERIKDAGATVLITQDWGVRGSRRDIPMKVNADAAIAECPTIEHVLVVQHTSADVPFNKERDVWYHDITAEVNEECAPEPMGAEDPLFILYTSGSTGKPKGVVHTTAGYLLWASCTFRDVFDYRAGDTFWCTADCGWITGHSYTVYGPLAEGAVSVMFEGTPTWPDPSRFWQVVARHHVTQIYTAPTALRMLMAHGDAWPINCDLSSIRILGTVGEPIKPAEWHWYRNVIGENRCPIVDTWWQTETGGIMIAPLPGATSTKPGSATFPLPGVMPVLLDDEGNIIEGTGSGNLCIAFPWPGMARTIWGDHERFVETYFAQFPGYYFTGDGCRRDEDGYYWITGRVDDIMIVAGHNIGTAEVEGAIGRHPAVAEAAVVDFPDDVRGNAIYAFVRLREGHAVEDGFLEMIRSVVSEHIGPHARPARVQVVVALPTTRSGKIMRRLLRRIAAGDTTNLGDTSTLTDPSVVDDLIKGRK